MEDTIYENENGKLVIDDDGELVRLLQYYEGEMVGEVTMYHEEIERLYKMVHKNES